MIYFSKKLLFQEEKKSIYLTFWIKVFFLYFIQSDNSSSDGDQYSLKMSTTIETSLLLPLFYLKRYD